MSVMTEPSRADVLTGVEEVWSSFLGTDQPLLPGAGSPTLTDVWSASVTISGSWEGIVTLELTPDAAGAVTRRMLAIEDVVDDGDVADAIGELVNMIGGNVKSLTPGTSSLSLPIVAAGHVARPSGAAESCRIDLEWDGRPLRVCVLVVRGGAGSGGHS